MITQFLNKIKEWFRVWTDPAGWDDTNDPCPYKCNCKKEDTNDKQT